MNRERRQEVELAWFETAALLYQILTALLDTSCIVRFHSVLVFLEFYSPEQFLVLEPEDPNCNIIFHNLLNNVLLPFWICKTVSCSWTVLCAEFGHTSELHPTSDKDRHKTLE